MMHGFTNVNGGLLWTW